VSFAAPRVGNKLFSNALNDTASADGTALRLLRVVSDGDFVPRAPPSSWPLNYYHAGDLLAMPVSLHDLVSTVAFFHLL